MLKSKTRQDFRHSILVGMGHPQININLTDEQLDQAINNALKVFFKYHINGTFESFYTYLVTDADVTNGYIPIPSWIDAVVEVLPKGLSLSDMSFATAEYQITRETFMSAQRFTNVSLVDYVCMKERLYNMGMIIAQPLGFVNVRYQRRLIPKFNWKSGDFIAMRCYENVDPENDDANPNHIEAGEVFSDDMLKELAIAFATQIWGSILKKFGNVVLPGGVTLNGEKMYDDATREIEKITREMLNMNPIDFMMG